MAKANEADVNEAVAEENPTNLPGFHVFEGKTFLGTFDTEEDAQAFIDGQLKPQDKEGKIIEGKAS